VANTSGGHCHHLHQLKSILFGSHILSKLVQPSHKHIPLDSSYNFTLVRFPKGECQNQRTCQRFSAVQRNCIPHVSNLRDVRYINYNNSTSAKKCESTRCNSSISYLLPVFYHYNFLTNIRIL